MVYPESAGQQGMVDGPYEPQNLNNPGPRIPRIHSFTHSKCPFCGLISVDNIPHFCPKIPTDMRDKLITSYGSTAPAPEPHVTVELLPLARSIERRMLEELDVAVVDAADSRAEHLIRQLSGLRAYEITLTLDDVG